MRRGRSLARLLAVRNLRRRPLRALLTTAGIILGVGMVVGVLSLSQTLLNGFEDLFDVAYGRTDLIVSKQGSNGPPTPFSESVLGEVKRVPGVDDQVTTAQTLGTAYLLGPDGKVLDGASNQLSLSGVEPGKGSAVSSYSIVAGRDVTGPDDFTVEEGWANKKGVKLGSTVRVAVPAGTREKRVTGIFRFDRSVDFGGVGFAAEPLAISQRDLQLPGQVNQIYVRASDRSRVPELQARLKRVLGPSLAVRTPNDEINELSKQLSGLNTFLLFFAGVALFVGAFLIFNAFNVTVLQRTREIGMLRTLGATRGATVRQVLAEAVAMGLAGSILGVLAGVGLAAGLIALFSSVFVGIPFGSLSVPGSAIISGLIVGTVITILAALWPAFRAGRTSPLQAMRARAERIGSPPWRSSLVGLVIVIASAPGVYFLTQENASSAQSLYGVVGVIGIFLGISLVAPLVVRPLVRLLSVPLRAFGRTEGRLAADNAARAPGRTALTASAVMIGLALVITFSAFSSSAISAVRDSIDRSLTSDFVIVPRDFFSQQGFSPQLGRQAAQLPDTDAATATRFGFARVGGDDTEIVGIDPNTYGSISATELRGGGTPDWQALNGPEAFVTRQYASDKNKEAGSTIVVQPPGRRPEPLRVAGVIDDQVETQSGSSVFVSTARAQALGLTQDARVYVKAKDGAEGRARLRGELNGLVARYPAAKLYSNEELKNKIEDSFQQIFGLLYALLGVAIVASAFGILNTLAMSVLERTREIGMVRAVGGTRPQIRRMIRRESILVTLVGVALGLVVGLVLGYVFVRASASSFPGLGFVVPWVTLIAVVVGAIIVAVLAAVLPARRAARLNVIEAVGYE